MQVLKNRCKIIIARFILGIPFTSGIEFNQSILLFEIAVIANHTDVFLLFYPCFLLLFQLNTINTDYFVIKVALFYILTYSNF